MRHRAATVGNNGGKSRTGDAHFGQSQMTENQQEIQRSVDDIDAKADVHGNLGLMNGPVHKGKGTDDAVENITAAGDAQILPGQTDDVIVAAAVKMQDALTKQLCHREKDQKIEEVHQQLEAEALLQTFPVPGAEKLSRVDVDARIDTEGHRAQQVVQLGGNRHRADTAHMAHHDGVHEACALVQNLLGSQRQGNVGNLFVKGLGSQIAFFEFC